MRNTALLTLAALLALGACAQNPDYGTGAGGTTGSPGTGGAGGGATGGAGGAYVPPALSVTHMTPIISRGKPVFGSPAGNANQVNNAQYHNGGWTVPASTTLPAWVAIKVGPGPTKILVSWDDGGTYNYQDPTSATVYGLPADYHFEVSPDDSAGGAVSTNGADGTWKTVGTQVMGNKVRTRAQSFDFTGKTWVKMVITAAPSNESTNGIQIGEIDVHDLSAAGGGMPDDTWFFMGDSITAFAYDRSAYHIPSFADILHSSTNSAYYPAMINGGIGGEKSSDGLARLADALSLASDYNFFLLGYGTNDAAGGQVPVATYKSNMQMMIDMVKSAGRVPIIPRIPYAGDGSHGGIPMYNAAVDELTASNHLQVGPDFYAHFMQNPSEFSCPPCGSGRNTDNLHPNDDGLTAMNQLWADAVRAFYP
jgi:lysophospholipase L1-like esterase